MGAKTWMRVYSEVNARDALIAEPALDRDPTLKSVAGLFPNEKLEPIQDGSFTNSAPPSRDLLAGCFPGLPVVAAKEFGGDRPSKPAASFIEAGGGGTIYLHAVQAWKFW